MCRQVTPSLSVMLTSVPLSRNDRTKSAFPEKAAPKIVDSPSSLCLSNLDKII